MFTRIKKFSDKIKYKLDIEKEISGYANIGNAPLFVELRKVGYGRIEFDNSLKYIYERQNISTLLPLCN